jgi:hypothetical protein
VQLSLHVAEHVALGGMPEQDLGIVHAVVDAT